MVSAPENIGVVQPRGLAAQAQAIGVVGDMFQQWSNTFYQTAAKDAERRAEKEVDSYVFAKDPQTGNIIPPEVPNLDGRAIPSIYDQAYHDGIIDRYQKEVMIQADINTNELAQTHFDNPAKFAAAFEEMRIGLLESVPENQRGLVDTAVSRMSAPYIKSINNNAAKKQHTLNQNTAYEHLDRELFKLGNIIASGGSDQDALVIAERITRELDQNHQRGVLDAVEVNTYNNAIESRVAFADIAQRMLVLGADPTSEESILEQQKMIQGAYDGTLEVNVLGRMRPMGEFLNEKELSVVAQQMAKLSRHYATLGTLEKTIERELAIRTLILPELLNASMGGPEPDLQVWMDYMETMKDPSGKMMVLRAFSSAQGISDSESRKRAVSAGIGFDVDMIEYMISISPGMEETLNALLPEPVDKMLEAIELLDKKGFPAEAKVREQAIMDRIRMLQSQTMPKAQQEAFGLLLDRQKQINAKKEQCSILHEEPSAIGRCEANANDLPFPEGATQAEFEAGAAMLEHQINKGVPVNWYGIEDEDRARQAATARAYGQFALHSPSFVNYLNGTADSYDEDNLQNALSLFETVSRTGVGAARLGSESTGIGLQRFKAFRWLSKNAGGTTFQSKYVRDTFNAILAGKEPKDLYPKQDQGQISDMLTIRDSKLAKDLPSEIHDIFFGDVNRLVFPDQLPAVDEMKQAMEAFIRTNINSLQGNPVEAASHAFEHVKNTGKYIQSRYVGTRQRSAVLLNQGFVDSLGRDIAPYQWVRKIDSPEFYYPYTNERYPNLEMTVMGRKAVQIAKSIDPNKDWVWGVNLGVERLGMTTSGKTEWRLVYTNASGQDIFETSDKAIFSFDEEYKQIKAGTLKNLELEHEVANRIREIENRFWRYSKSDEMTPIDPVTLITLREMLRQLRSGKAIPKEFELPEEPSIRDYLLEQLGGHDAPTRRTRKRGGSR